MPRLLVLWCAGMFSCVSAAPTLANPMTFTVDSTKSQITLAIELSGGTPVSSPQTAGSDTTSLSGTANVDVTSSTIQFLSSAGAPFALQPMPQSPLPNGAPGTAPA